jgi:hypothetical protein
MTPEYQYNDKYVQYSDKEILSAEIVTDEKWSETENIINAANNLLLIKDENKMISDLIIVLDGSALDINFKEFKNCNFKILSAAELEDNDFAFTAKTSNKELLVKIKKINELAIDTEEIKTKIEASFPDVIVDDNIEYMYDKECLKMIFNGTILDTTSNIYNIDFNIVNCSKEKIFYKITNYSFSNSKNTPLIMRESSLDSNATQPEAFSLGVTNIEDANGTIKFDIEWYLDSDKANIIKETVSFNIENKESVEAD